MVDASIDERRLWTDRSRKLIRQQQAFHPDTPLNHCFEWCASIVPSLVYSNPTVKITEAGHANNETEAVEIGIRNLIERPDWRFSDTMRRVAYDQQFDFGVLFVYGEPMPDYIGPRGPGMFLPHWPCFERVSPRMFFRDSRTPELGGKPRFDGHIVVADRLELEKMTDPAGKPLYDQRALQLLADNSGMEKVREELRDDGLDIPTTTDRWLVIFEVYIYPTKAGTPGAWVSMGWDGNYGAQYLRATPEREAYCCPADGPYTMFGTFPGIDRVYPVPNLAVTKDLVEEHNKHRRKMQIDAESAKNLVIINGGSTKEIATMKSALTSSILSIPGFNGMLNQVQIAGVSKDSYGYADYTEMKLDRLSGLTDVARGNVDAQATATAVAQAGAFTDVRMKHAQSVFIEQTEDALGKVADLLMHCNEIRFPVTVVDQMTGQTRREDFVGGIIDPVGADGMGPMPSPWKRRIVVEVEPNSMSYRNEQQYRMALSEAYARMLEISAASMADPSLNVGPMIDDLFESLNIPEASRRYINIDLKNMMSQLSMMQMMAPPAAPGGAEGGKPGESKGRKAPPGLPAGKPGGLVRGQPSPVG